MIVVWPKHVVQRQRRICCVRRYLGKPGLICFDLITTQQMQATKCVRMFPIWDDEDSNWRKSSFKMIIFSCTGLFPVITIHSASNLFSTTVHYTIYYFLYDICFQWHFHGLVCLEEIIYLAIPFSPWAERESERQILLAACLY
jgi:hypothetical protein